MKPLSFSCLFTVAALSALSAGCAEKPEPLTASSANEATYAAGYPEALSASRGRFAEQEKRAQELSGQFQGYPDELDKPSWPDVKAVYERADQAGRGESYAARAAEVENVAGFYEDEKDELHKKVGGAANYVVKQKSCDADVYGATSNAMDKGMEKQLEERMREQNEAQHYIEDNVGLLGKANVEKLQKQADDIAFASYLVHVGVKQTRADIERKISEASDVKSTLDKIGEESDKVAADTNRSEEDRAAAKKRGEAARTARAAVDGEVAEAEKVLKGFDEQIKQLNAQYDEAFDKLNNAVDEKAKAEPPAATAAK
jgi:hypothetical protein